MKVLRVLLGMAMLTLGFAGMMLGAMMLRVSFEGFLYIACGFTLWYIYYLLFTARGKERRAKAQAHSAAKRAKKAGGHLVVESETGTEQGDSTGDEG